MALLEPLEIVSGTFSLIFVIISVVVGLKIASKYFEFKQRDFLLVGIVWILIVEPWYPSSISFLVALFNNGQGISDSLYFIIGNVLIPISVFIWMIAFTDLLYKEKQIIILVIFTAFGAGFYILFFSLLLSDPSLIGTIHGIVDVEYQSYMMIFLLAVVAIILITGIIFARESLKSTNSEVKLKGHLLMAAFILWSVGAILDAAIPLTILTLIITRAILILSSIAFYGGFILPKWMKNIFLGE